VPALPFRASICLGHWRTGTPMANQDGKSQPRP